MSVELDTNGNGAIDIERGGTNATTALQALSNLGGQPVNADLDIISTGTFAQKRALIEASAKPVSGIANLRLTIADFSGDIRYLTYHTSLGDGGDGIFIWDASTVSDNNGTIIQVTGVATGRWIRQTDNIITPQMFGGMNSDAIQAAINYVASISDQSSLMEFSSGTAPMIRIHKGIYDITDKITIPGGTGNRTLSIHIKGDGRYLSVLRVHAGLTSSAITSLFDFPAINPPTTDSNSQWTLEDLGMEGPIEYETHGINAINATKSAYFTLTNCFIRYFDKAVVLRNWSNKVMANTIEYCNDAIYITEEEGIGGQTTINDIVIQHNIIGSCIYGVRAKRSLPINMISILNNEFDGASRAAILISSVVEHAIIKNNYFEAQGRLGDASIQINSDGDTALVEGAIILHPTTNNPVGVSGEITNNYFTSCNLTSIISMSGNSRINIEENSLGGLATAALVSLINPVGFTLGPLPYTSTQKVRISGSTKISTGDVRAVKLVNIDNTLGDGRYSSIVIDNQTTLYKPRWFINDLRNGYQIGTAEIVYDLDLPSQTRVWKHATADGSMVYRYTLTVSPDSSLSGAYLRLAGQAYGDDGTGNWIATIVDSGVTYTRVISSSPGGVWALCRNQVIYIPVQASGSREITIDIDRTGTASNAMLRGFSICDASFEIGMEPVVQ